MGIASSGRRVHARRVRYQKVYSVDHCPAKQRRGDLALVISFRKAYEEGVLYPHDDALVAAMLVANFTTRRILIDKEALLTFSFGMPLSKWGLIMPICSRRPCH